MGFSTVSGTSASPECEGACAAPAQLEARPIQARKFDSDGVLADSGFLWRVAGVIERIWELHGERFSLAVTKPASRQRALAEPHQFCVEM